MHIFDTDLHWIDAGLVMDWLTRYLFAYFFRKNSFSILRKTQNAASILSELYQIELSVTKHEYSFISKNIYSCRKNTCFREHIHIFTECIFNSRFNFDFVKVIPNTIS